MATKAQEAQNNALREKRVPRAKKIRPKRNAAVDTALAGVNATDRKAGRGHTGLRNVSKAAAKKGGAAFEDSETDRPSRKSTRRSAGHVKLGTPLTSRQTLRVTSPKAKATRAGAAKR